MPPQKERYVQGKAPTTMQSVSMHKQCAEKFLKAILQEQDIPFGKTHNLIILLEIIMPSQPSWELLRPSLESLTGFGVHVRYPGESSDKATAREALAHCRIIRLEARKFIGLEED